MAGKPLHVVCLDAPAPPDYGGAIDMYYKIQALHKAGFAIRLHYFAYKEGRSTEGLEQHCSEIHRYARKSFAACITSSKPFIVASRINKDLEKRLSADDHPVLLEGIHTTGLLPQLMGDRKIVLRMHNDEAAYYKRLAATEKGMLKKLYLLREAFLLRRFQHKLPQDLVLACVASNDMEVLQTTYGMRELHFIPSFTPWQEMRILPGSGDYCLYHGNMEVPENYQIAEWLANEVFDAGHEPFYIAGKAADRLSGKINSNVKIIANPDEPTMESLVRNAQVHILPSLNSTGLKLKMLHALFCGRHCITNEAGIAGTAFRSCVHIGESAASYRALVASLFRRPFTGDDTAARQALLHVYSNELNAAKLSALLS